LYKQVYEAAGDIKPRNISVDTLSRAFAGNEIDRTQVYAFASYMQALAMVAGGSVTVLSHPSLHGVASGSGISGSTAWHGAFRFRQYLKGASDGEQPDGDLRELEFKKDQYGPLGETVRLRWQGGVFVPVGGAGTLERVAAEAKVDQAYLDCLDALHGSGRQVGPYAGKAYAPAIFEKMAPAKGYRAKALAAAQERLFNSGRIEVVKIGPPSKALDRIARKPAAASSC
jgi:RecA-family ATPase